MAVPSSAEARLFYRCAFQRFDDARVLREMDHTTGAVYLAGYGVECILKALILGAVVPKARSEMLRSFRGNRAHDFEWLRTQYRLNGGSRLPRDITRHFTLLNDWSTELRYVPRRVKDEDADVFLTAAASIIGWADGRL